MSTRAALRRGRLWMADLTFLLAAAFARSAPGNHPKGSHQLCAAFADAVAVPHRCVGNTDPVGPLLQGQSLPVVCIPNCDAPVAHLRRLVGPHAAAAWAYGRAS